MAEIRIDIPSLPTMDNINIPAMMEEIGGATVATVQLSFARGQTPTGERWKPLSPSTIARRRNGSSQPLRDTGRLMNSIQYFQRGGEMSVGSNLIYANIHNYGGNAGRNGAVRIPQRRFLPDPANMPQSLMDEYNEIAINHIINAFNNRRGFFSRMVSRLTGLFRR